VAQRARFPPRDRERPGEDVLARANCAEMTWLYTNGPSYDEPGEPGRTRGTTNSSQGSHGCRVRRV